MFLAIFTKGNNFHDNLCPVDESIVSLTKLLVVNLLQYSQI